MPTTIGQFRFEGSKFQGNAYIMKCKGNQFCENLDCSYFLSLGIQNTNDFVRGNVCRHCSSVTERKQCTARRYVGFGSDYTVVLITMNMVAIHLNKNTQSVLRLQKKAHWL